MNITALKSHVKIINLIHFSQLKQSEKEAETASAQVQNIQK
jgi:hypothetical protein